MFLRATIRKKDGKEHTYYSVVENKRLADGRVVQLACRWSLALEELDAFSRKHDPSDSELWRRTLAMGELYALAIEILYQRVRELFGASTGEVEPPAGMRLYRTLLQL